MGIWTCDNDMIAHHDEQDGLCCVQKLMNEQTAKSQKANDIWMHAKFKTLFGGESKIAPGLAVYLQNHRDLLMTVLADLPKGAGVPYQIESISYRQNTLNLA